MTNLAIIDNHQIFREGLHRLLEPESDLDVIASTNSFSSIDEEILSEVNLYLVDIDILQEEKKLIHETLPIKSSNVKIIALSTTNEKSEVIESVLSGYDGFLLKEMSFDTFIHAVRIVIDGGVYIHPQALHHIVTDYRKLARETGNGRTNGSKLPMSTSNVCTTRESEILQLLVNGNDNNSIAKELKISEKTVKNHLTNIFRKLNVKDRTQAAVLAIRNEWVQL